MRVSFSLSLSLSARAHDAIYSRTRVKYQTTTRTTRMRLGSRKNNTRPTLSLSLSLTLETSPFSLRGCPLHPPRRHFFPPLFASPFLILLLIPVLRSCLEASSDPLYTCASEQARSYCLFATFSSQALSLIFLCLIRDRNTLSFFLSLSSLLAATHPLRLSLSLAQRSTDPLSLSLSSFSLSLYLCLFVVCSFCSRNNSVKVEVYALQCDRGKLFYIF